MIQFDHVCFGYDGLQSTLEDISFHVVAGEFVAVAGSNGAGKSTLAKLVNGLARPTAGRVVTGGMDTRKAHTSVLARSVGFLFQNPDRQICQNTVREEIQFGLTLRGFDPKETHARCQEVLDDFGFDGNAAPFSLSRGERQRLALASLLALRPRLLILDEPTTGLDYRECTHIMQIVRRQNCQGATVLMISHDMEIVQDYADRVLVLHEGRLLGDGPARRVLADRELLAQASLLPPQIADLALRLGEGFEGVFTAEEMVGRIEGRRSA